MSAGIDELFSRVAELSTKVSSIANIRPEVDDLKRQIQQMQGTSGTLEPLSLLSGWNESVPSVSPVSATFVAQGQLLLAGSGVRFEKPANSPYLRIKTGASNYANYDYVVDSNGLGTHLTLHGASGALAAAIATGLSRSIWICTTHTETTAAADTVTLTGGQVITVNSAGGQSRPTITVSTTANVMNFSVNGNGTLKMMGFRYYRTQANAGNFAALSGGVNGPGLVQEDMIYDSDTGTGSWAHWLDARTDVSSGNLGNIYWRRVSYSGLSSLVTTHISSILATRTTTSPATNFVILDSDFTVTNICYHSSTNTDSDPGKLMQFTGNRMTVVQSTAADTGYGLRLAYVGNASSFGLAINDNSIIHKANNDFLRVGDASAPSDITMNGNAYNANNVTAGAATTFANLRNTGGTVNNVSIAGNVIVGPGSGNAINVNGAAATASQFGLNAFKSWTNNVTGAGAMTTIFGPVTFGGTATFSSVPVTISGNADALTDNAIFYLNTTGTEFMSMGFRRSSATKGVMGIWDTTGPTTFAANDLYFTTYDGSYHDMAAFANDGTKFKLNTPLISGSYGFFGSVAFALPTNTTAGDLSATRLFMSASANVATYARVGSASAPTNTTAGDLTVVRLSVGNSAAFGSAGNIGSFVDLSGSLTNTAAGAISFMGATPTYAPASASSTEFRNLYFLGITSDSGGTFNILEAIYAELRHRSTQTIAESIGSVSIPVILDSGSPATAGTVTQATSFEPRVYGRPSGTSAVTITSAVGLYFKTGRFVSGAGATITDLYNIKIEDQSTNTITTFYGIDIAKLTRGTTNVEFRNAGKTVHTPTTQTVVAGTTIPNTASTIRINSAGNVTMTSTPTLATTGAQDGQIILVINNDTADTITLQDESGVAGTKLRLPGAANAALGPRDALWFQYDSASGEWWAVSPIANN